MAEFGIFLVCAVIGFVGLKSTCNLRHRLHGNFDEVLPHVLLGGFVLLSVGYFAAPKIGMLSNYLDQRFSTNLSLPAEGLISVFSWRDINAIIASLLLGYLAGAFFNCCGFLNFAGKDLRYRPLPWLTVFKRRKHVWRAYEGNVLAAVASKHGDDFIRFQMEATERNARILVTLTNQRVYFGIPAFELRHPKMLLSHGNFRHLRLVPLLSGYRDNERKKVTLTDSHPAHDGSSKSRSLIEIPYDQIVSLQLVNASFLFQNAVMDEDFLGSIARAA